MKRKRFIVLAAVLTLLPLTAAFSQYTIPWFTIDGGGTTSTGGTFSLTGTIGQPDASSFAGPISNDFFSLVGGFWPAAVVPSCALPGDMDLSTLRNGVDIQGFVRCLLGVSGTNCACADMSGNGTVGVEDIPGFVAIVLGM